MNLILAGFMGTGKTTVGRHVATRLSAPFFDVDETIQERTGRPISEIFDSAGEQQFRTMESAIIKELVQKNRVVIAAGGGSLLDPQSYTLLEQNGILVCLTAT